MNIYNSILPPTYRQFFAMIDECQEEVELITANGFHLNMKSKLCQYVILTSILMNREIKELTILTQNTDDLERIVNHLV